MALLLPDVDLPRYGSKHIVLEPDGSVYEKVDGEIYYKAFPIGKAYKVVNMKIREVTTNDPKT